MQVTDVRAVIAIGLGGQFGLRGRLPWEGNRGREYVADVERFFELTRGHVLIMGHRTFTSVPDFAFQNRDIVEIHASDKPEEVLARFPSRVVFIGGGPPVYAAYAPFIRHWDIRRLPYDGEAALLERLASEPHTRLRYFCSPQHTDSAFYPIISQMERAAGLAHDDTTRAKLDKLDAVLAQTSTPIQDAALFAEMLSLLNDGRYPPPDLAPQERRQKTQEALTAQLAALTRQRPALMIVEDAHWVDPTSLEVFGRTVGQIKTLPVLLIVTFRPEFDAPWAGRSHVASLALNRLGEREAAAIIARIVGNKDLPADVTAEIVERTDGIPLFVEEMTKAVLEAGSEDGARQTATAMPSPSLAVPASLHASLMARLDRLGPAKEVAQIGAAIGREFSHALILAVADKPQAELRSALNRLIQAGLVFRQGEPPHATYLFKHALVQDAAHGTRSSSHHLRMPFVETTRRQELSVTNSSLWRTKKELRFGRRKQ